MKKFIFWAVWLVFVQFFIFLIPNFIQAATDVSSDITEDTLWTKDNSPYIITGNISLLENKILTIQPGTIIKFNTGNLNVHGALKAYGTNQDPIYFTSYTDDTIGGDSNNDGSQSLPTEHDAWGINFYNGSSSISHALINYSGNGFTVSNASLNLDSVDISKSNIFDVQLGQLKITNSTVHDINSGFVFDHNYGDLAIASSTIETNGTHSYKDAITVYYASTAEISDSKIINSGQISTFVVRDFQLNTPASLHLQNTELNGSSSEGISAYGTAQVSIDHSILKNFPFAGIFAANQVIIHVTDSILESNDSSVIFYNKVHADISTSTLKNNKNGTQNFSIYPLDARNNWWGSAAGPYHPSLNASSTGDQISDNVNFDPWLQSDPNDKPSCCSSVIFIPGIEASRLYIHGSKIWEPSLTTSLTNNIKDLFLDATGKSFNPVTTKDVIDAGIGYDVYAKFIKFMENLVSAKTIESWKVFPYDWRMNVKDIVSKNIPLSDNTSYNMVSELEKSAASSQTGKVTLIAHSNGGLVVKALIKYLKDQGRTDLLNKIDKIILVAVPQLGTPMAIPALLHGYNQEIGGIIVSAPTARDFSKNMPGAYGLLPSREYFERSHDPVISFDSSLATSTGLQVYGQTITDYDTQRSFLLGEKDTRSTQLFTNIWDPITLSESLLDETGTEHSELDSTLIPDNIHVYQIVGEGLPTIRSITYQSKSGCVISFLCLAQDILDEKPVFGEGDGTVLPVSAQALHASTYYINLHAYNTRDHENRSHTDILEIPDVDTTIKELITNASVNESQIVTRNLLEFSALPLQRVLSIHSPVSIDIYDGSGNHTGLVGTSSDIDLEQHEAQIPNSMYMNFGEGKYLIQDADTPTQIILHGTGTGTFTLDVDTLDGSSTISHAEFTGIPVTPDTIAEVQMSDTGQNPMIMLDIDGDGVNDFTVSANQGFDPELYLEALKKTVLSMHLAPKTEKELVQKINKILDLVQKNKLEELRAKIGRLIPKINFQKKFKNMTAEDKENFIKILSGLLDTL